MPLGHKPQGHSYLLSFLSITVSIAAPTKEKSMSPKEAERRSSKRKVSQLIAGLMRGPCSVQQLALLTGYSYSNVQTWVESFHDLGLVFIARWEITTSHKQYNLKHYSRIFQWCDGEPFSRHDAERPISEWLPKGVKPSTQARYNRIIDYMVANPGATQIEVAKACAVCHATVSRASSWKKMKQLDAAKAAAREAISKRGKTA